MIKQCIHFYAETPLERIDQCPIFIQQKDGLTKNL